MNLHESSPEKLMAQALAETLENLVFEEVLFDRTLLEPSEEMSGDGWWVKVSALKPVSGDFYLIIRKGLMLDFTAAMLGMTDQVPTREQVLDSLGELQNTICGRFMALVLPQNQSYLLGLPEIGEIPPLKLNEDDRILRCLAGDNELFIIVPKCFWQAEVTTKIDSRM